MSLRRLATVVALGAAGVAVLVASGTVELRLRREGAAARALDLFGSESGQPAAAAEPFWLEGQGRAEQPPAGPPPSFADLTERTSPAVVSVQTTKKFESPLGGRGGRRHPLEEFFGEELFGRFPPPEVPGLGSGFVISQDGYIVTNNHVIEDVDKIVVQFEGGMKLDAEIVGRDPKTDLALIRVKPEKPLVTLPLGDSDAVRPGDWVVAIGNPYGLEHTVTAGIVSAKHRVINQDPDPRRFDDFIQTDAAINPGNSGGPLLNLAGEVIGINTAINPRANTIGFAVPVNMAKTVLPQLRTAGRVSRGWLGVYIQGVDDTLAEQLGLEDRKGALVSKVEPGSPAAVAGIERGDLIVEFDGKPVEEVEALPRLVAGTRVGNSVNVVVVRKGKRKGFEVKLGELEKGEQLARGEPPSAAPSALGVRVQDLTPEIAQQLELEEAEGVVVTAVEPGSPAAEAGLRRGDVISELNQAPVRNTADFQEALERSKSGALFLVRRGRSEFYVGVKPSEESEEG
jgi:serine protease Do